MFSLSDGQCIPYLTDGIDTELPIMMAFDDVIGVMVTIGGGGGAQWLLIRQRILILINLLGQERNYCIIRGQATELSTSLSYRTYVFRQSTHNFFSRKIEFFVKKS